MARKLRMNVGELNAYVALYAGAHKREVVGFFAGGTMPYPLCIDHVGRYSPNNRGQLMTREDAISEGLDPEHPDFWCYKCMTAHGWATHEYVIQGSSEKHIQPLEWYEVLDLSAILNDEIGPVVKRATWPMCNLFVDVTFSAYHHVVYI